MGGREIAKGRALRAAGVRMGATKEVRLYFGFMILVAVVGTWGVLQAIYALAAGGGVS